jgi:hypothetical protein
MLFESMNPYEKLFAIVGEGPDDLVRKLTDIKTPIKIIAIVPYGVRQVAYVTGHVTEKPKKVKTPKEK